jgi:hypothetical protein
MPWIRREYRTISILGGRAMTTDEDDRFEHWLAHMDDALAAFFARVPPGLRAALDFEPASLDRLEAFLLERYASVQAIKADPEPYLDAAARYVGEVFRRHIGGRWRMRMDDPKYVYAGLPELTFSASEVTPVCPITLVSASLDRRTGAFISGVFDRSAKRVASARG